MKTTIKIIQMALFLCSGFSFAQKNSSGVYLNATDFLNNKITHAGKNTNLSLHENFGKQHLEVKCKDSIYTYLKKDVFGYSDKEGKNFRFFNSVAYTILNPKESILLYQKTSGSGLKGSPIMSNYFFSKDAASDILPLNLQNLERVFTDNKSFSHTIEMYFKNDTELIDYDNIHKIYKLNRILELSKNENTKTN